MSARLERRKALNAESPEVGVFLALVSAHDALIAEALKFFQNFGVTLQQYNVLRVLYVRSTTCGLRCSDIAERMLNREPDMTRLIDRLEKAELLQRHRCTEDRRVVWIELTEKGFDLVEEIHEPLLAFHRELFGRLTRDELEQLKTLLGKLATPCSD